MDKISAKKQLLKDANAIITHVNDIAESEEVGIAGNQADALINWAERLKDYIENELLLSDADERESEYDGRGWIDADKLLRGKRVSADDEEEWERRVKQVINKKAAEDRSDKACAVHHQNSCETSHSRSTGGCGGSGGRGC